VKRRLHVQFEVTECYKYVARIRLVETENPNVCTTVKRKVCKSAVALYYL
jgi:hypothetical protein